MCEFLPDRRRYVQESDAEWSRRNPRQRCQAPLFACRTNCDECAGATKARLMGNIWAAQATSDRDLFVTTTYDDRQLDRLAGSREAAADIDVGKPHFSPFIQRFRDMLRRLHPDLVFEVKYFKILEYGDERGRVHHHALISINVWYRDPELRKLLGSPGWTDKYIPGLRLNERYIHEWETEAGEAERRRAKALAEGKRYRAARKSLFPARVPWPWGFIHYANNAGGVGNYLAGYAVKGIEKAVAARRAGYGLSEVEQEENRKLWQSYYSKRSSKAYGHRFYAERGRLTASQGLPPNTYFKVPMGAKYVGGYSLPMFAGANFRRRLKLSTDGHGGLQYQEYVGRWYSTDYMLTGSAARAYLDSYDAEYVRLYGDRRVPRAACVRTRRVGGLIKQYYGYGIDECREQKEKRELAQEDHSHLEKRRKMALNDSDTFVHLRVSQELAARHRPKPVPPRRVPEGHDRARLSQKDRDWFSLVESWSEKVSRDFKGDRDKDCLNVLVWMKSQPALAAMPPPRIYDLWKAVMAIRIPAWKPWRKGDGGNGYAIRSPTTAPQRFRA